MSGKTKDVVIAGFRGGRNGWDPPEHLPEGQCADAVNVHWATGGAGTIATKRNGATADTMTFSAGGPFAGASIYFLGRHVPGTDPSLAELWAVDANGLVGRKAASTQYAQVTLADAISTTAKQINAQSLNAKFFMAYVSGFDRLHCWDPVAGQVRRTGLAPPAAAPTVANGGGGGAYPATLRYYRVRYTEQQSGVTVRRGEPSASVSFTPSGANANATVTKPAAISEGETHWELEASADNASFYLLATTVIGTTTFADTTTVSAYASGTVSAISGTYTVQKSYLYIAVDQNRLLGFGSNTSTDLQNAVEFSAAQGSLNVGDVERVPTGNTITLDENDSGSPSGLVGPMNGRYFAFKTHQIWMLVPTGDPITPFQSVPVSKVVGAMSHQSIVLAEDQDGNPAIYFMSSRGPYRYGQNGLEWITTMGGSVLDLIVGPTATMLYPATPPTAAPLTWHSLYHADRHQVWFFTTVLVAGNATSMILVWDVLHSAWSRYTGPLAVSFCSVMFSDTISGAGMSTNLKPYIAQSSSFVGPPVVWKGDSSATDDAGTAFQATVTDKARAPWGLGNNGSLMRSVLVAKADSGVTITQSLVPDFGAQPTNSSSVSLTPAGSETKVVRQFESAQAQGAAFVQMTWGDASAISNAWSLDAVVLTVKTEEPL